MLGSLSLMKCICFPQCLLDSDSIGGVYNVYLHGRPKDSVSSFLPDKCQSSNCRQQNSLSHRDYMQSEQLQVGISSIIKFKLLLNLVIQSVYSTLELIDIIMFLLMLDFC